MSCHLRGTAINNNTRLQVSVVCENFGATQEFQTNLQITNPVQRNTPELIRGAVRETAGQNPQRRIEIEAALTQEAIDLILEYAGALNQTTGTVVPQRTAAFIDLGDPSLIRPRIGVMGDSITHIGSSRGGYIGILQRNIPNSIAEGHGIVGNRTGEMRRRFQEDILNHNYNIVIIEGGVNDLPAVTNDSMIRARVDLIERNITRMAQMARDSGAQVIILTVMPWAGYGTSSTSAQRATEELNRRLLTHNDPQNGIRVISMDTLGERDSRGFLRLRSGLSLDNLHPINVGQQEIARAILSAAFGIEMTQNSQNQQRIPR
jgi:lysophospholipase L1-like esterase